jgi:EAL domain-containing protein (putative c-di-GMP-specific phosphodiesterase class I)/GGDEF domain-containing protein
MTAAGDAPIAATIASEDRDLQGRVALALVRAGGRVVRSGGDVALVDAALPRAAERVAVLRRTSPERPCVVIAGREPSAVELAALVRAGASACIRGDEEGDQLREILVSAGSGGLWLPPSLALTLASCAHAVPDTAIPSRHVRAALDERPFEIVLQPIADLRDRSVLAVEAFARFEGPQGRAPAQWLEAAEAAGLRQDLELALVAEAVAALPRIPEPVLLSVNLSPATALDPRLADVLDGVPLRRVVLELCDHAAVSEYELLAEALSPLRERGLRLAVDDSGQGLASVHRVGALHPALIKAGRSLTRDCDRDPARRALLAALSAVADQHGATLVAGGIETEDELRVLTELGVTHGQGFLFAAPAPPEACPFGPLAVPAEATGAPSREALSPAPAAGDLRQRARAVARVLSTHLPGASVCISHLDYGARRLGILAVHGPLLCDLPPGSTLPLDETPEWLMAGGAGPRVCDELAADPVYGSLRPRGGCVSFIGVPVELADGSRAGAISVFHPGAGAFHARDLALLESAAATMADAVAAETAGLGEAARTRFLRRMVHHDEETGTLNADGFGEALRRATAREGRFGLSAWLVRARLEGIDEIVARRGHTLEHLLLRDLAAALREAGLATDEVGRVGRHELATLLTPTREPGRGPAVATVARHRFREMAARRGVDAGLTVSAMPLEELDGKYPGWDSNPHWIGFEPTASTGWATRALGPKG